jgi:branched-chain amino acid transport system ATP-binding protein
VPVPGAAPVAVGRTHRRHGAGHTNNTIDLLKQISDERDITIAIIEHDMHVVFSLANRITVLAQGTPLVEDDPENIRGNPKVREAYLGESA